MQSLILLIPTRTKRYILVKSGYSSSIMHACCVSVIFKMGATNLVVSCFPSSTEINTSWGNRRHTYDTFCRRWCPCRIWTTTTIRRACTPWPIVEPWTAATWAWTWRTWGIRAAWSCGHTRCSSAMSHCCPYASRRRCRHLRTAVEDWRVPGTTKWPTTLPKTTYKSKVITRL